MEKKFDINKTKTGKFFNGYFFAIVGLLFMAIGVWRGEVATVCTKAIQICLECIGIG